MKALFDFLKDLSANNNRQWFTENKDRYELVKKKHLAFIQEVIQHLSVYDPELIGLEAKETVYRIYRDVRFSPDKSPYKTHIGAYLCKGGRKSPRAGYYIHLEPGNSLFAGGIWCPEPQVLKLLRAEVYNHTDEFLSLIQAPAFTKIYALSDEDKLKKVPAPSPKDAPNAEWVKYKSYTAMGKLPDAYFSQSDIVRKTVQDLSLFQPLNHFLNQVLDDI